MLSKKNYMIVKIVLKEPKNTRKLDQQIKESNKQNKI